MTNKKYLIIYLPIFLFVGLVMRAIMQEQWQKKQDEFLITAIKLNNTEAVIMAFRSGANANACDSNESPPSAWQYLSRLFTNKRSGFTKIRPVALLVEPYPIDRGGAHHHISFPGKNSTIVKLLLDHGADVNAQDEKGYTPLMQAIEHKQYDTVRLILRFHPHLDIKDTQGLTAFDQACGQNDAIIMKLFKR